MIDIPDSIFPRDSGGALLCPKCRKTVETCDCPSFDPAKPKREQFVLSVRLDRKGRKGKSVTLVRGLPADEKLLHELSKTLKTRLGGGGTFYIDGEFGVVEVQGEHVRAVVDLLAEQGFQAR